jgi:putative SOS response-associated peptidase YedK
VRTLSANNKRGRACADLQCSDPKTAGSAVSYNITPSQNVLAIRFNTETRERTLDQLRWGLIPHWAKDQKIAYRTINARAETVDKAPTFRQAFIKRRCLIPADGFYEWRKTAKPKLPFAIAMLGSVLSRNPIRRISRRCGELAGSHFYIAPSECGVHYCSGLRSAEFGNDCPCHAQ